MVSQKPYSRLLQTYSILRPLKCSFSSVVKGSKYTPSFKQYLKLPNGEVGSYFHDIPLDLSKKQATATMVVEIPRWSNAKFEISKEEDFNPIIQDSKKGKLRYVDNLFPYHGYMHNYGALTQTWEDPSNESVDCLKGDNDPLDCCEIGSAVLKTGDIKKVKILGALGLIDDGELDWKVIVINLEDPIADRLSNLSDVEKVMPSLLNQTREWFRNYKIPAGKPANKFVGNEKYLSVKETLKVIEECHESWKRLICNQELDGVSEIPKLTRAGNGIIMKSDDMPDSDIPSEVDKWHFI